jgi:hypothetical protein
VVAAGPMWCVVTAPADVRAAADRLTLVGRLIRLRVHARSVADGLGRDADFARLVLEHLGPAVAAAEVQADEVVMLRAEAADREHARGALQAARTDVAALMAAIDGMDPSLLSKAWLMERLQGAVSRVDESLRTKESTGA